MRDYADIALQLAERAELDLGLVEASLIWSENQSQIALSAADHAAETNLARQAAGKLSWDGLVLEAGYRAAGEVEPHFKRDALEVLACVAIAHIVALDEQVADFNAATGEDEADDLEALGDGEDA